MARVNGQYHTASYITKIGRYGYVVSRRTWLVGSSGADLGHFEREVVFFDQIVWC